MSTAIALEKIKRMTAKQKAEFDAVLDTMPRWVPQPGPQRMAYESQADILFYGGSAGGGKTDLLLGLCLTSQEHSIIFRREAVQLIGIEERMSSITGSRNGYNSTTGVWRLPGGKVMELGSVKEPMDWMKFQGRAHDAKCVGRGTMVKMSDGLYKAIESIQVGDVVATMEGGRKVTKTFKMTKPAVLAEALVDGVVIAQQIQSRTHRILSPSGWVCRDMTLECDVSSPTSRHSSRKYGALSQRTFGQSSANPQEKLLGRAQQQGPQPDRADYQSRSDSCVGAVVSSLGSGFVGFAYRLLTAVQHSLRTGLQALAQPFRALLEPVSTQHFAAHGACGAPFGSSLRGYPGGYWSDSRRGDAQPHGDPVLGQQCLLLRGDVAQQNPKHSVAYAQAKTPTHTRREEWYSHPYTKEKRRIEVELLEASLRFSDVGDMDLFDLTVDEANYYITAGGIVNSNCFDEICHFLESQFRALIGWLRSDNPNIRQRVVCAGNPPTSSDGQWVKRFWAAWLDPTHPNPAKPGELRWYVTDENGDDLEVPSGDPVKIGAEIFTPKSRTFIPSSVDDNLFLASTGYKATLQSLPEPLRSQMLRGDFQAGASDPAWQLVPTEWVKAAQQRWIKKDAKGLMTAIGFDPARGGTDKSTAARRHGTWFDEMISVPGTLTKDGPTAAGFIVPLIRNGACVCVDSIGIGSSALDFIRGLNLLVLPVVGSAQSGLSDKAGQLRFRNKRAEMYWRLREALDPTNPDPISLPPDQELFGDLCAVRYKVVSLGKVAAIQIREKDEIREAIGRSPDKGDAVAMTFVDGIPKPGSLTEYTSPPPPPDWRM